MDVVRGRWVKICRWFVESSRSEYVYEWVSPGNAIRDLRGRADIGRTKEKKITMGTDTSNLKHGLGRRGYTPVSRTNNICWEKIRAAFGGRFRSRDLLSSYKYIWVVFAQTLVGLLLVKGSFATARSYRQAQLKAAKMKQK